ncbi:MAG: hypothetical protein H0W68_10045 [Gemmatimonadaceae bacterium]|nr:hypothetical protein [Gemmatimonadaceae bacterium]
MLRQSVTGRLVRAALTAAAALAVLVTASPLFADGIQAIFRPVDAWNGALLARPRIDGAPRELLRGTPLPVRIVAPGRRTIVLVTRQTGAPVRRDTLAVDAASGTARTTFTGLQGDVQLVASDGRASSDTVTVRATDRAFLGALALRAAYPGYLRRADESIPAGEVVRVPRGTIITVVGRSSVPLSRVGLVPEGGTRIELPADGHAFSGRFTATHSARYRWEAGSASGVVPDVPDPLDVDVVPDSVPTVSITAPACDTVAAGDEDVPLGLSAADDHGLASVRLRVARGNAGEILNVGGVGGASWSGTAVIPAASLHLQPGESVRVQAEAVDASPWAQRGTSRELVIRRATSEEQRVVARALGDSAVRAAREAVTAQQSLAQRTDEAARAQSRQAETRNGGAAAASKSAMTYERAEKARALAQEQRAMSDRVQRLRQETAQLERQLKAAGALDTALGRQLREAQALLQQAMTPEMTAQMQKLERASQQMSGEQSRDALRDLAQMQQRMKEQLERSAEILKRAAHEGAMQTLADEARELAAKDKVLAESSARSTSGTRSEQTAAEGRDAKALAERSERLRSEMESLKDRLTKDKADAGASRTERAAQYAARSEAELSRNTAGEDVGTRARAASAEMDRAAEAMRDARAAQVKEWKQELTAELDRAVQEMLQLAREERALEQQARSDARGTDRRGAQSAVQQGTEQATERLNAAGKKSALLSPRSQRAVSDARGKVSQATQQVTQRPTVGAGQAGALSEAADALTRAAASLARDRERANAASSASGFSEMIQQLREAADKQGQINSGSQNLLSLPNGAANPSAQGLARALARQQRSLADKLDDAGDMQGGTRAEQLAREARQLADALDAGRLDGGTLARQQQLFRRLLDAGRALEKDERDDGGKREARAGTPNQSFSPGTVPAAKPAVRFRAPGWEELRGLSADERRAIQAYFTRLNGAAQ